MALFVNGVQIGPGKPGKDGPPGPANSLSIAAVETLPPGSAAEAVITGTAPSQQLSLKIPRGDVGPAGLEWRGVWNAGTAYVADDAVSYDGTSYFCLTANTGQQPTGLVTDSYWAVLSLHGAAGPANVITIGNVTTLPPGTPATADLTGASPSQVLNLGIPSGEPAVIVNTVSAETDIPTGVTGFYFVSNSEKGDSQMYLLVGGVRYWMAMVRD
ncbi:carbohydrate-binding protein [Enterobacter sp. 18A13]|uniref:carbohydrate-binding protein n=1 Tax=Enterobacter sp. 18A13 TaxID=2565914 RepID=UPI0010CA4CA8|nr:carbohydrate-binding protein [Enterobacter sp. 18A13]BBJ66315.1 hypothetical protein ECC18A13_008800 [Enterobacter sp. 18A13]